MSHQPVTFHILIDNQNLAFPVEAFQPKRRFRSTETTQKFAAQHGIGQHSKGTDCIAPGSFIKLRKFRQKIIESQFIVRSGTFAVVYCFGYQRGRIFMGRIEQFVIQNISVALFVFLFETVQDFLISGRILPPIKLHIPVLGTIAPELLEIFFQPLGNSAFLDCGVNGLFDIR